MLNLKNTKGTGFILIDFVSQIKVKGFFMRKQLHIPLLLSALLLLSSCGQPKTDIAFNADAILVENVTLQHTTADQVLIPPSMQIEADDSLGTNLTPEIIDPAKIPAGIIESILPSPKQSFSLPEVVRGPLANKDSNGITKYIANLNIPNNKVVLYQSTGRKLKADTSKLNSLIKNYPHATSVLAVRISDGSYVSYNVDSNYACASTIKAPYAMYAYSLAANKQISLTDTVKYQSYHYISGSGMIKNKSYGTPFTIRDLVRYSMIDSDNVAHMMLTDRLGKGVNQLFEESGSRINMSKTEWPLINARDVAIWWNEILEFRDTGAIGKEFFDIALSVRSPILNDALGRRDIPFAHKSGWVRNVVHEAGVVMTEDPYIIVVLTTKAASSSDTYTNHIVNVFREVDKIMQNK